MGFSRLDSRHVEYIVCPACSYRFEPGSIECPACGIVLSKHLDYIPSKVFLGPLSVRQISDIRKTKEKLETGTGADTGKFFEILLHCSREGLLDLAAYHLKAFKDESSRNVLKNLLKRYCVVPVAKGSHGFLEWITKPFVLLFFISVSVLLFLTLMLRISI